MTTFLWALLYYHLSRMTTLGILVFRGRDVFDDNGGTDPPAVIVSILPGIGDAIFLWAVITTAYGIPLRKFQEGVFAWRLRQNATQKIRLKARELELVKLKTAEAMLDKELQDAELEHTSLLHQHSQHSQQSHP